MYLLELAGEEAALAEREAATAASDVAGFAPGLATAGAVDADRVRGLAYTRRASAVLGRTDAGIEGARKLLAAAAIDREGTVAVRARDVRGRAGIDTQRAERELGAVLVERGFEIDLDAPDQELRALFAVPTRSASTEGEPVVCVLGWLRAESVRDFGERAPTKKPFFQPGSMDPLLARAIANLAGAGPGRTIFDPTCGTGGLLVESGLLGADVIGLDAQRKMAVGARTNLAYYLGGREGDTDGGGFAVLQGDGTRLPLRGDAVDGVCFDVPYGRQSKIAGERDSLVVGALDEARRVASRAVIVGDRSWREEARQAGWEIESCFERRVHRSLTRHIAVLDPIDSVRPTTLD